MRSGDSLYAIARRYKTSVRALRLANNLHSSRIYAGQLLKITSMPNKPAARRQNNSDKFAGVIEHRVRRGDSLYRIARQYNTSIRPHQTHQQTQKIQHLPWPDYQDFLFVNLDLDSC